jgi:hypothetical protein
MNQGSFAMGAVAQTGSFKVPSCSETHTAHTDERVKSSDEQGERIAGGE